jgi:Holliday junction DNA helicase RuvA
MIERLSGRLAALTPEFAVVEVNGVGYLVAVALSTYTSLSKLSVGDELILLTEMTYSEKQGPALFGFLEAAEREVFRLLLGGSGVGPKLALAAVSSLRTTELLQALTAGDFALLSRVPGIGRKKAEKLSLELRDAAGELLPKLGAAPTTTGRSDAVAALVALGYPGSAARGAVAAAEEELPDDVGPQRLIAAALSRLRRE